MRTQRRGGYTLVELFVVLGIVAIVAAVLWPMHTHGLGNANRSSCQQNLRSIGFALLQYSRDYDERLVPAATGSGANSAAHREAFGWADTLGFCSYMTSTRYFQCPSEGTSASKDAMQNGFTDYWMNRNLSRAKLKDVGEPAQTILCGEGNDGSEHEDTSARYNRNFLPRPWLDDERSPARRHLDTMNILFADGHVKALKAERVVAGTPRAGEATFAVRWGR